MFDEITRILNHLMWLGAHGLDIGAMTVFLYCFREREDLMDCYEAVSGTRMHATYYRPGGVYRDLPARMPQYEKSRWRGEKEVRDLNANRQGSMLDFLDDFVARFPACVDEYETLLTDNRIWKQRTVDIGIVTPERALALGFTGPSTSTSLSVPMAIATRATWFAWKKCVSPHGSSNNAWTGCARILARSFWTITSLPRRNAAR
jgi:NADH-quinone oxidoreductase subunit D